MTSDPGHVVQKTLNPPDTVQVQVFFRRFGRSETRRALFCPARRARGRR